jgi:hypothetical protein
MQTEKEYYEKYKTGKTKYRFSLQQFREVLYDYQPSQIWLAGFSKDYPYIEGNYRDKKFSGAYVKQCGLTFHLDSLKELESVFIEGMYIYV